MNNTVRTLCITTKSYDDDEKEKETHLTFSETLTERQATHSARKSSAWRVQHILFCLYEWLVAVGWPVGPFFVCESWFSRSIFLFPLN